MRGRDMQSEAKVLTVYSWAGGVGRTQLIANVGLLLARRGLLGCFEFARRGEDESAAVPVRTKDRIERSRDRLFARPGLRRNADTQHRQLQLNELARLIRKFISSIGGSRVSPTR